MKRLGMALILAYALSVSALAGEVLTTQGASDAHDAEHYQQQVALGQRSF
jgi:hypothetical protein